MEAVLRSGYALPRSAHIGGLRPIRVCPRPKPSREASNGSRVVLAASDDDDRRRRIPSGVIILSLDTWLSIRHLMFWTRWRRSPARTRRIWSRAAKDLILAEASVAGANISAVARAHGVSVHQVFRWRREAQKAIAASRTVASATTEPALLVH